MDKISKLSILPLVLVAVCFSSRPADADTSIYVFDPSQSTVTQTGGLAGVHETYSIEGMFQLTVDLDAGTADFDKVDANLAEPNGFLYTQSLDVLFNMTGLAGIAIDDTTIEFEGKTTDGTESDVRLKLSLMNGSAHLTGNTTPPPNSADMFIYDVNAIAIRKYTGGTGEPNDPYQIATAEDLMLLSETPEDYDKHFILTADIDLDPNLPGRKIFDKAVISADTDTKPWFQGTDFSGTFDGNGHRILHLMIEGDSFLGLFGYLDFKATILNLRLESVRVRGEGEDVAGGLVGANYGSIHNCYSSGTIRGHERVGGLVGLNGGNIYASYSKCTVFGENNIGGLVGTSGFTEGSTITNCYSAGIVSGLYSIGGLVGNNASNISMCYSISTITGDRDVGGLVGVNFDGVISASFWDVETSGLLTSDGGLGKTTAEMYSIETFLKESWDFKGEMINGMEEIWQILEGKGYPRLWWELGRYSGGTGEPNDPYQISIAYDLLSLGESPEDYDKHFIITSNIDLTGKIFDRAVIAPDPANLIINKYEGAIFSGVFNGNDYKIIGLRINGQGNSLIGLFGHNKGTIRDLELDETFVNGYSNIGSLVGLNSGTISNCLVAGNVALGQYGFNDFAGGLAGVNLGTISDCHFSGSVTGPESANEFMGGLVGQNGLVRWAGDKLGGTIIGSSSDGNVVGGGWIGGLVGNNSYGSISNCFSMSNISGQNWSIGGLAGANSGEITNCSASGAVTSIGAMVGGLVGYNNGGYLLNCVAKGNVYGGRSVGGLVGTFHYNNISNCYSTSSIIEGKINVGGLIGRNQGGKSVTNCYSTDTVIGESYVGGFIGEFDGRCSISGCFWDVDTSGQTISGDGIGKTTAEMQTAGTFLEAGWDFVGETANGTEDIWWILEGQDYPRLWWELSD